MVKVQEMWVHTIIIFNYILFGNRFELYINYYIDNNLHNNGDYLFMDGCETYKLW